MPAMEAELKKVEEQEKLIQDDIKELTTRFETKDPEELTPSRALLTLQRLLRFL